MRSFWIAGAAMIAGLGLVTSCATMSPDQCATADWRQVGYNDGAEGRATERFADHAKACAKAGFAADQNLYMTGRADGLRLYCRPERGFSLGRSGSSFTPVCPPGTDAAFRIAYEDGRRFWSADYARQNAENALNNLRNERDRTERHIDDNERALINAKSDEERRRIREELIRLRNERASLDRRLPDAEHELHWKSGEAQRVRSELYQTYGSW
jgi:hypothetical protein